MKQYHYQTISRKVLGDLHTPVSTYLKVRDIFPQSALMTTRIPVDFSPYRPIDIVGTGGDGKNTFNISTCACFIVAGAGYKVAKHGNYGATSVSGASNVIEQHAIWFRRVLSVVQ